MKQINKWISILLVLSLLLPVFPAHVHAADEEPVVHYDLFAQTAPAECDTADVILRPILQEGVATMADESEYLTEVAAAGKILRETMKQRSSWVTILFSTPADDPDYNAAFDAAYDAIVEYALMHTGVPTEGDYLAFQHAGFGASGSLYESDGSYYFTMEFQLNYKVDAQQEATMDVEVPKLLSQLNLGGKSDYEKVKTVYDWICANVTYDYDNLNDPYHQLKYTAYAALVNGTSVCQGFAVLFYRLMLELGVDARVISGIGNGGAHSWNIVQLNGQYYNLDATWDEPRYKQGMSYEYFLCNTANFYNHVRDEKYETSAFHSQYPMAASNYVPGEGSVAVTGVRLDQESVSLLTGESMKLTAAVSPSNASNKSVVFTSSNPEVATVNASSGVVTAVGVGETVITVTTADGGYTDSCTVTVTCDHIFNAQIEEDAYLVPETANNCQTMKEYYYACSLCGAVGTDRWVGSQRGDHVIDYEAWESAGEIGHWHPCANCDEGGDVEPHTPNMDAPTADQDKLCTVCGYVMAPRLDPDHVVAEGLWDFGPVKWKITGDGTLTISGNTHIQGKSEYIWKEYSHIITRIVIEDGITTIPEHAFSDMDNVTSVYLSNALTIIREYAFADCSNLKKVEFPASLITIEHGAFGSCMLLDTITFADDAQLEYIGSHAFNQTALKELTTPASLKTIDEWAFSACTQLEAVHLSEGLETILPSAFAACTGLKSISIPSTATEIHGGILNHCYALEHFEHYSIASPGALENRTNLKSVIYAGEALEIPTSMFSGCTALTDVTLGDKLERIGDQAFFGCSALPEINIPDSVTFIGSNAFYNTAALKELTMPTSLETISAFAFQNSGLQTIYFLSKAPEIDSTAFTGVTATAYYPNDNSSWSADMLLPYGGSITWTMEGSEHVHTYMDTVIAPTCTEAGYTLHECSCGNNYTDSEVPALGHSFLDWYEDVYPTCMAEGVLRRNCERCFHYESEPIPMVDHNYQETVVEPTCIQDGYKEFRCEFCGDSYLEEHGKATGLHEYSGDWDIACDICGFNRNPGYTPQFFDEPAWTSLILANRVRSAYGMNPLTIFPRLLESVQARIQFPETEDPFGIYSQYGFSYYDALDIIGPYEPDNYLDNWGYMFGEEAMEPSFTHFACTADGDVLAGVYIDCLSHTGESLDVVYNDLQVYVPDGLVVTPGMSITELGLIATVYDTVHGICYFPVIDEYVTGYDSSVSGPQTIVVSAFGMSEAVMLGQSDCDHAFGGWIVTKPATATEPGLQERDCLKCGYHETQEIPVITELLGDLNGDGSVTSDDAIYLLYYTLFGDAMYPVSQNCDYNGDGTVNSDDAIYLLYYTLFGDAMYPLTR